MIEYRQLIRNAKCSSCDKMYERDYEYFIVIDSLKHKKKIHICPECIKKFDKLVIRYKLKNKKENYYGI